MSQELLIAASALAGLLVIAYTVLNGWRDWLALKTRELETGRRHGEIEGGAREGGGVLGPEARHGGLQGAAGGAHQCEPPFRRFRGARPPGAAPGRASVPGVGPVRGRRGHVDLCELP